jgi:hypothetical protein
MGGVLDIKWAHNGIVTSGHYCTAQGIIQQIGELGVALITLVCPLLLLSLSLRLTDAHLTSFLPSTPSWGLYGEAWKRVGLPLAWSASLAFSLRSGLASVQAFTRIMKHLHL